MAVAVETVTYEGPGGPFEGVVAYPEGGAAAPGILIAHSWVGQGEFEADKARMLAKKGYVGFAIDVYGQGKRAGSVDEAAQLMNSVDSDRPLLQARMQAAAEALRSMPAVDAARIAAIGFCFGGKCVLDLARSGADVAGVASFHGVYDPPSNLPEPKFGAKIMVLHGWDDPLAPPAAFADLADELTKAGADWQAHAYGHTGHAFTNPQANMKDAGLFYVRSAERRAFAALDEFLGELFG